jgi:hypothetical protein
VFISRKTITSSYKKVIEAGSTSGMYRWLEIALARHSVITKYLIKVFVFYIAVCYTLLVEKIDMSKRDRCGSIATLEKCFGFAPTSQHRAAKYVGNLNMGPDKQETGSFRSNYPGGQMS